MSDEVIEEPPFVDEYKAETDEEIDDLLKIATESMRDTGGMVPLTILVGITVDPSNGNALPPPAEIGTFRGPGRLAFVPLLVEIDGAPGFEDIVYRARAMAIAGKAEVVVTFCNTPCVFSAVDKSDHGRRLNEIVDEHMARYRAIEDIEQDPNMREVLVACIEIKGAPHYRSRMWTVTRDQGFVDIVENDTSHDIPVAIELPRIIAPVDPPDDVLAIARKVAAVDLAQMWTDSQEIAAQGGRA